MSAMRPSVSRLGALSSSYRRRSRRFTISPPLVVDPRCGARGAPGAGSRSRLRSSWTRDVAPGARLERVHDLASARRGPEMWRPGRAWSGFTISPSLVVDPRCGARGAPGPGSSAARGNVDERAALTGQLQRHAQLGRLLDD